MLEVKGHNVIVGVDRSGSMDTNDCDGQTRYAYLGEKLAAFVGAAVESAYNNQVIALFFSNNVSQATLKSADEAKAALTTHNTGGGTATHKVLEAAFKLAQQTPDVPAMFFLATDGIPDSEPNVDSEIVSITKRLKNPEDFRIMILTVGKRSDHITQWLQHLDADLGGLGAAYDIVGQNNLNQVDFQEAAAELIKSTTTNDEALAGSVAGKTTTRID